MMCAGVQVIDARDPLTYRSNDLEQYARDIAQHKGSLLLLNKADLLSAELRTAWADYFDERGVSYVFWSAKAAADALKQETGTSLNLVLASKYQCSGLSRVSQRPLPAGLGEERVCQHSHEASGSHVR